MRRMSRKDIIIVVALFVLALVQVIYKLVELKKKNDQEMTELYKMKEQLAEMNKLAADSSYLTVCNVISDSAIKLRTDGKTIGFKLFNSTTRVGTDDDTLKFAYIFIPALNHETPVVVKATILKAIANYKHLNALKLYSSMNSYYEQINNDVPTTIDQVIKKKKIIWDGFIGTLSHGKYYENRLE